MPVPSADAAAWRWVWVIEISTRWMPFAVAIRATSPESVTIFRFDGSEFISESSGSHCVWNGEAAVLIGIRDVSDRVAAEEKLRASEERYGLVANATNDGIWDWNLLTNEAYRSARWWEILGYAEDEILPRIDAMPELIHPDDCDSSMQALKNHIVDRAPFDTEYRVRQKSGAYIWVRTKGQALWDENGMAYRMAGSTGDISETKAVEEELRQVGTILSRDARDQRLQTVSSP